MTDGGSAETASSRPQAYYTIVTTDYLVRTMALHESMMRHCRPFRLTAFCLDRRSARILRSLQLEHVDIVRFSELEAADPALRAVKPDRTLPEYCHTAKAPALLHLFDRYPELEQATYLDSDLFFFASPDPIFEEMGDASILITPHRFSPEFEGGRPWGLYNGGMFGFRRDRNGLEALRWWRERCLEWCHIRLEPERATDQKYLNDWPERFDGVHVLRHKGGHVAPWNVTQFTLQNGNGRITLDGEPLLCFHFQGSILRRGAFPGRTAAHEPHSLPYFQPSDLVIDAIYVPYFAEIDRALSRVRRRRPLFTAGFSRPQ